MLKRTIKNFLPNYILQGIQKARGDKALHKALEQGAAMAEKILQQQQEILLEIGAGNRPGVKGWTTLDICENCDIYWDLFRPLPFPDNSINKIYSSHVLEHFYYPDIVKILQECYRVLKSNGVISICVPNANLYLNACLGEEQLPDEKLFKPALNFHSKIDFINYIAYMDGHHKYMFDQENLLALLTHVGFINVQRRSFDAEIDKPTRDWESIYAAETKLLSVN